MEFHRLNHGVGLFIQELDDELVGVDGLDPEAFQYRRREIAEVERDDESRFAVDRRGQHVTVIGVGKRQGRDEGLVLGDEAIGDVIIHQLATSSEAGGREIGTIGGDVPRPLVMDLLGPTGLEEVREGELHEQIAERGRVQDAGVVEDDRDHGSVAHIEVLAQGREFFE
jgi:hypothetical protein